MMRLILILLLIFPQVAIADYLGSWKIDDTPTFAVNTHDAATGAATDADSAPTYRVYEDETGTAILNGTMALLDDANTVGFYSEQLTCSAANGFEKGKSYTIRVAATVDSIDAAKVFTFQIEAEVDANIVSDKTGYRLSATGVDDVWDELLSGHGITGSAGLALDTASNYSTEVRNDLTDGGRLDLIFDATLADTNELQSNQPTNWADFAIEATTGKIYPADGSLTADTFDSGLLLSESALANAVHDAPMASHVVAGSFGAGVDSILDDTAAMQPLVAIGLTGHTPQTGDSFARIGATGSGLTSLLQAVNSTTIATLASQTSFTLTAGSADNDAYNDAVIIITDASTATQKAVGYISDYVGSTKTVTLGADPGIFTMAVGDSVTILPSDKGLLADVAAIATTPDTRDLEPVAHANTWKMVQRAGGVISLGSVTIYQGETKRVAFDCSGILGVSEVLASMSSLTGSVANLTATEVGIDPKNAKADMACGAAVAAGTYNIRTTITTSVDSGPILLIGTVIVVED